MLTDLTGITPALPADLPASGAVPAEQVPILVPAAVAALTARTKLALAAATRLVNRRPAVQMILMAVHANPF